MKYLQLEINKRNKNNKLYLLLIIIFSSLLITSLLLFIFLSNYKIQILLSVLGSIVNSLLTILLIIIILVYFLPNRSYLSFYNRIIKNKEEIIAINKIEKLESRTIRKNITLDRYLINDKEYHLLNNKLEFKINDQIIVLNNYIIDKRSNNE